MKYFQNIPCMQLVHAVEWMPCKKGEVVSAQSTSHRSGNCVKTLEHHKGGLEAENYLWNPSGTV